MITFPALSEIPTGSSLTLPVADDGTGTACTVDDDCPGGDVDTCLAAAGEDGFCTQEGCGAGDCAAPYVCCRECAEAAASQLPFEGSACFPAQAAAQLVAAPVSCTCD
jgi:hypothetical protein